MSENKEKIRELESKLHEFHRTITDSVKSIGVVTAGPFKQSNDTLLYRVSIGSSDIITTSLPSCKKEIKLHDEVLLFEEKIVDVIHQNLEKKKAPVTYELNTWDDIIGIDSILSEIKTSIKTLSVDDKLFQEFGVKPVKGILLYGLPGNGKTLIGKAIASDILNSKHISEEQFIFIKGGEMLDKYVGETEQRISQTFKRARDYTKKTGEKVVIFIDEADAILGKRQGGSSALASTVVPTFLSEMDGLEGNTPFVLLSTNLPNSLDEAVIRDGRIDQKIEIPNPDMNATEKIFNYYLKKVKCYDCEEIAKKATVHLFETVDKKKISGAMISNITNLSAKTAAIRYSLDEKSIKAVCWEDVEFCISKLK